MTAHLEVTDINTDKNEDQADVYLENSESQSHTAIAYFNDIAGNALQDDTAQPH